MILAGHDDLEAGCDNGVEDLLVIDRDDDPADRRFPGAQGHLNDHRQAANIGERLARKAGGRHAGGDQNQHAI